MGTAIPNADLKIEEATHYEIGYSDKLTPKVAGEAHVFYSDITNLIQATRIANTACSSPPCTQNQNVSKSSASGFELELHGELLRTLDFQAAYAYLDRQNRSNDGLFLTDSPRQKVFGALTWHATGVLDLVASSNGMSSRYSSSDGKQKAPAFAIANLKAAYRLPGGTTLEAGVYNVFDKLYYISEGYPEAGRTYFTNINVPL
jgi:iron complex outermembrane receptor protein